MISISSAHTFSSTSDETVLAQANITPVFLLSAHLSELSFPLYMIHVNQIVDALGFKSSSGS